MMLADYFEYGFYQEQT